MLAGCAASLNGATVNTFDAAEQPSGPALASAERVVPNAGYLIGPLDVLDISVFKVPELSKTVQVAASGTVNLPLVGEIPAAGRTPQEVERDLTSRLGAKYVRKPHVTVYVKEFNSQRITIEGAVKKPGVYPIKGHTSLLQVIATAEGLDTVADTTVLVIRRSGDKRTAARFDVNAIRTGEAKDPAIQSGDMVIVGVSAIKEGFSNFLKILPAAGIFAAVL